MPSPFPGMNPYLEQSDAWEDFHHRFMTHAADFLNDKVGERYVVKIVLRPIIHELSAKQRRIAGIGVEAEWHGYLQIHDLRRNRPVTIVELLGPTNKASGPQHSEYLTVRNAVLGTATHLVEIDLLRGGKQLQPRLPPCDYYALVSRHEERPNILVWSVGLRDKLPVIPIPLAEPDADVSLDLQAVLHHVYDLAGYAKYIYSEAPKPPLSAEDTAWAQQILANRGTS